MEDKYPLFTVIIPQKNRSEYLVHTIKSCMIQDYPNFEIIISDDFSDDDSVEAIKKLQRQDSRIKLIEHDHHIGMRDNFEEALRAVRPGYVIALGGDDGLVNGGIRRMYELIKETGREILCWRPAYYKYPDETNSHGQYLLKRGKRDGYKFIKSTDFLNKIAHTFQYQIEECPMFYMTGVVSTNLINKVRSRSSDNCFYHCPTPDGFSGVVLAGEVEDYVFSYEPLSIVGTTTKSQGKNYMRTDDASKREAQQFFNDNIRVTMHRELASQQYSPLQTLMTADYLLTAKDLPGWPGKFDDIDFSELIKATFKMLEKSPFENETLIREMKILRNVAIQHNLLDLFDNLYINTKRKVVRQDVFEGFVITPRTYMIDGALVGINNIYDASLVTPFASKALDMLKLNEIYKLLKRTFKALKNSRNYKVESLPTIEW